MRDLHGWIHLRLIDGMEAWVRADMVAAVASPAAFSADQVGPGAATGAVVSVGVMLLRTEDAVASVMKRINSATM